MNKEPNRDEILTAAANGNGAALEFLRVFARRAHFVDDLADEPIASSPAALAAAEAEWLLCLTANPFFLAHKAQLVPAMVLAINAWVDSHSFVHSHLHFQESARDVIKGQWHEVVWLVAWLTGGWQKLREVSGKYRSYDFEAREGREGSEGEAEQWRNYLESSSPAHPLIPSRDTQRKEANGLPG